MVNLILRITLASVFGFAGIAKLRDIGASRQMLREFGVPELVAGLLGWLLPVLELATAVALVSAAWAPWGAASATSLLSVFTGLMLVNIALGRRPRCRCFGQVAAEPIGQSTVARNVVLLALALLIVTNALRQNDALVLRWAGANAGKVLGAAVVLAFLAAQTFFLLQILRQQGRMLLRLDTLSTMGAAPVSQNAHHNGSVVQGLPVGETAPDFDVPLLGGGRLTLKELLSAHKPVVLFFMHPGCGPCRALLPQIARWNSELAARLTLAVISEGSVRENRRFLGDHEGPSVGLQKDQAVSNAFGSYGTPAAVMIGPNGRIKSRLAAGAEEIERVVYASLEPLAVGDSVPELSGKTSHGELIKLRSFKGREVILIFWSAQCGYCRMMSDELIAFDREGGTDLVVVAPFDDPELTRELRSPLVIDPSAIWSRAFAASGTPMAIRIDARGLIASTLVAGKDAVLRLLYEDRSLLNHTLVLGKESNAQE
jgi:thiol-disulfide isomerase/thioredoxin/uncharacterized membrane protein YphA (DoxX/SURF4 family)